MFRLFYNLAFPVVFAVMLPRYLWRMHRRGGMTRALGERLGIYSPEQRDRLAALRSPVWIHAVSVGEMMMAAVLTRELHAVAPEQDIVVTTTTVTGRQVGRRLLGDGVTLLYNPIDWFFPVRRAFRAIRPRLLVLMEQEIWPNYVWEAAAREVPVWLLNARLSERSFARFRKFKKLLRPILGKLSLIAAQDEEDTRRLADAGFPAHAIFCPGSMKFDVAELSPADANLATQLRASLGWRPTDPVLLAGSTFPGEERIFLALFAELKRDYKNLRLVLAPRHCERATEVEALCRDFDIDAARRGALRPATALLLDTTGELSSLYDLGTVNFVGKSLCGRGGQNFIEAARAGKPVIVGPNTQNFARLTELFLRENALLRVRDDAELKATVSDLLSNEERRSASGAAARRVYLENLGAGKKSAAMISRFLTTSYPR